jgi:hypothetical protein
MNVGSIRMARNRADGARWRRECQARPIVLVLVVLAALPTSGAQAQGVVVGSQLGDGLQSKAAGAGTWTGFAYTQRTTLNGAAAVAPANGSSSWYTSPIATGGATLQSPVPLATTTLPGGGVANVNLVFGATTYGPSVSAGRAKNLLVAPLESESVSSASGAVGTEVHAIASYNLKTAVMPNNPSVTAYTYSDHATVGGRAAAIAYDPYTVTPSPAGGYQYGGSNLQINFNMALGTPQDIGDVKFEAFDSRLVGGGLIGENIIYGTPLWSLLIESDGVALQNKSNITVAFNLNPDAVTDGIFTSTAGPINVQSFDSAIDANVLGALSVTNGVASLGNYQLFPATLMYNVSSGSVQYASDTGAGFTSISTAVPAPQGLVLFGLGLAGALGIPVVMRRRSAGRCGTDSDPVHVPSRFHHRRRVAMRLLTTFARRLAIGSVCLGLLSASPAAAAPAFPQYTDQESATSFYHSGIVTSTGVVWDTAFANMVTGALKNGYNEIGFAFMECFGGGMIDELKAAKLTPASYTSAAVWNQPAWATDPTAIGGNPPKLNLKLANSQSTYNAPYAASLNGGATLQAAARDGYNGDVLGPVRNLGGLYFPKGYGNPALPVIETPQYTSSGASGDSITLHQNNPNNPNANTQYRAIVFGGSTNDISNRNSTNLISTTLTNLGYKKGEVQVINPGGTAAQLKTAWNNVAKVTNAGTQIYYWNSWGHGSWMFDVVGRIKALQAGAGPMNGLNYNISLTSDYVADVLNHASYVSGLGDTSATDAPYVEIETSSPNDGIGVMLNGQVLSSLGSPVDLFGDGTEYDYLFALNSSNLASLGTSDSFAISWTGGAAPNFDLGGITDGMIGNYDLNAVPEPASCVMFVIGVGAVGAFVRYRRRHTGATAAAVVQTCV